MEGDSTTNWSYDDKDAPCHEEEHAPLLGSRKSSYDDVTFRALKRRYWKNLWVLATTFTFIFSSYLSLQVRAPTYRLSSTI